MTNSTSLTHQQINDMILNLKQAKPAGRMVHALITITAGCDPVSREFPTQYDMMVAAKGVVMSQVAGVQKAPPGFELKLVSGDSLWTWAAGGDNLFVGVGDTRSIKIWKEVKTA